MKTLLFSIATDGDDREIRELLREVPMRGAWRIGFGREPSFFACPAPAGMREHCLVARREGRLVSVGCWSARSAWLCEQPTRVGYLHGLRMKQGTEGSMRVLREGYAALAGQIASSGAEAWFTSIDAANSRARRVLESRASGLPRYRRIGEYRTRIWPVWRRGPVRHASAAECPEEVMAFLNRHGRKHDLALLWDTKRWEALCSSGFDPADLCVVRKRGRMVAVAGLWDQSCWKQVVLHAVPRPWRVFRPVAGAACLLLGTPSPPAAGTSLALGHVFPFAMEPGEAAVLDLWPAIRAVARRRGIEWLALGLDASAPLWQEGRLPRMGMDYHTILHQVCGAGFPDALIAARAGRLRPESATL